MEVRSKPMPLTFESVVAVAANMHWRRELIIEEIPAPSKLAPFSFALNADLVVHGENLGNSRLVLLHDPSGNDAWEGCFRCVCYVRANVDPEMVTDPLLVDVGWSWLIESLEHNNAAYAAPSGTITAFSSKSYGAIENQQLHCEIEMRASWTPIIDHHDELTNQLHAWSALLCACGGLPALPQGVVPITRRSTWNR